MSRVQIEIFLGTLLVLVTGALLVVYGLGEEERMALLEREQQARAIEVGAELYDINCDECHGPQGEGVLGLCPPLNDKYFFAERMKEVGWSGSLEDYIVATVSSGRMTSTRPEQYAGQGVPAMPAWSEDYAGPLRADQIRNIAAFIMNWESTAPDRREEGVLAGPPVGTDITISLPVGDPANGEPLATAKGCVGCHVSTATGPAWAPSGSTPGMAERAALRIAQADYTGSATDAGQYLLESIVSPKAYVVEGYLDTLMPTTFGSTLTAQDAADIIAYMLTFK
ncbi:MAG TPA: c-type cytochrome [Anaerolineales bacterium]|nr:c-type cytochrome [Anaerolineales bacterium]